MGLAPGATVGPYRIESLIGAGGMGEVYKARDTRLERAVAIKVLPPAAAGDPDRRARFEREAKSIAAQRSDAKLLVRARGSASRRRALHSRRGRATGGSCSTRMAPAGAFA